MESFYDPSLVIENTSCAMTLLLLLRNQLANYEFASFSSESAYNAFTNPGNQLKLLHNGEAVLNWKPQMGESVKNEAFPAILELETTPFRRGPPGCEEVLRRLFSHLGNEGLRVMVEAMKSEAVRVVCVSEE